MSGQPTMSQDDQGAGFETVEAFTLDIVLSIIAPAHNEQDNISDLLDDIQKAMSGQGIHFEVILVDDGSTDQTAQVMAREATKYEWLSCFSLTNTPHGKGNGQSAAFYAGIRLAGGSLIALMDADRQNDPADLPAMLEKMAKSSADMVQGDRSANREDTWIRRATSWVGLTFRRLMLGDTIRDTGCSLRVFKREVGLVLPLQYAGMHRFIPFYARNLGFLVIEAPVHHRARTAGIAKYGIWNRALPGLRDLIAVRWMRKRLRDAAVKPLESASPRK